jgi:hypothetical protein
MLTFKQAQDTVLERFNDGSRSKCKEWLNYVLGQVWGLEEWTFKRAVATVTVTAGSTAVTGLPADIGIVRLLQNAQGGKLTYREWDEFMLRHYGETGSVIPYDFTLIGTGAGCQMYVGPPSSETSSAYQVLYERERGYYPSTTLNGTAALPTGTITVASTAAAPTSGTCLIGGRLVTYTGTTGTTLTGCTGGTGTFTTGDLVVFLSAQAGDLAADSDVPLLPPETHQLLVHAATAIGQTGENDYSLYLSDDRVQQGLDAMRRRYLIAQRGETEQWGSYGLAHFETGGSW